MASINGEVLDTEQVKQVVRKKRGSKSASLAEHMDASREDIARIVGESFQYFNRTIVKTDEECAERLNDYFRQCNETGQIPTVEDMCLALGTYRQVVWRWENGQGCSKQRSDMIRKAKQILAGIDGKMASEGKIPQVVYIFRAKNFHGMADTTTIEVAQQNPLGDDVDQKKLEDRIANSVVVDAEGAVE